MPENTQPESTVPQSSAAPQARSPFVFDLRELGRRPGTLREYRRTIPAPARIGLELVAVAPGAPLDLDVRLESVTEGVLVTGTVTAPVSGQCGRCLEPFTDELVVDLCELFAYAHSTTDETSEDDEVYRVSGDRLDLEPVVHESIVLALPLSPLCRPECAGLCAECGQRLDDLPAGHAHDQLDPRWSALAAWSEASPAAPPNQ